MRYLQTQLSFDIYLKKTRCSTFDYFKTNQFAAHLYYLEICTNAFMADRVHVEYKRPYIMNLVCLKTKSDNMSGISIRSAKVIKNTTRISYKMQLTLCMLCNLE